MVSWVALVVGVAFLALGALGFRKAFRLNVRRVHRAAMWSGAMVVGAISSLSLEYPLDERTRVYGFPLPAAVFQRDESGTWLDFVGPLTTPFMLLNALVNTGVVLYVVSAVLTRLGLGKASHTTERAG